MNYDTTYNIPEHNLQIVVDETGDIFINTLDYSACSVLPSGITEVCVIDADAALTLSDIFHTASKHSIKMISKKAMQEIADDK